MNNYEYEHKYDDEENRDRERHDERIREERFEKKQESERDDCELCKFYGCSDKCKDCDGLVFWELKEC